MIILVPPFHTPKIVILLCGKANACFPFIKVQGLDTFPSTSRTEYMLEGTAMVRK